MNPILPHKETSQMRGDPRCDITARPRQNVILPYENLDTLPSTMVLNTPVFFTNHPLRRSYMDHIKLVIYGLIVTAVVFGIVGMITKMLGIQQY
jgi:hypothetical protein